MATVISNPVIDVFRTAESCPYQAGCRYGSSCRYIETTGHAVARHVHNIGEVAAHAGKGLVGAVCLLTGFLMSITLLLLPIGVPLALLGVAILMTSWEPPHDRELG